MCGFIWGACVVLMRGFIQGACMVLFGGMCGFIWGACVVLFRGHAWFYLGACVVARGMRGFIRGVCGFIWGRGACMVLFGGVCGFIQGACMVLFRGMHGFIWGAFMVLFRGACMVLFGGHAWFFQFFRIQWDTVNERAVRNETSCYGEGETQRNKLLGEEHIYKRTVYVLHITLLWLSRRRYTHRGISGEYTTKEVDYLILNWIVYGCLWMTMSVSVGWWCRSGRYLLLSRKAKY